MKLRLFCLFVAGTMTTSSAWGLSLKKKSAFNLGGLKKISPNQILKNHKYKKRQQEFGRQLNGQGSTDGVVKAMVKLANDTGEQVTYNFNGVDFVANPGDDFKKVREPWAQKYETPEAIEQSIRDEEERERIWAEEKVNAKKEITALGNTPARSWEEVFAEVQSGTKKHRVSSDVFYAMQTLKHPGEIKLFADYIVRNRPELVKNARGEAGSVHFSRVQAGTNRIWLEAIDEAYKKDRTSNASQYEKKIALLGNTEKPRTGTKLMDDLEDAAKKERRGSTTHYALENLKHPAEIREYARTFIGTNRERAVDFIKYFVEHNRVQPGTEKSWLGAIEASALATSK